MGGGRSFQGGPAEEILSPVARPRGTAALRLYGHLPRGGERRGRGGGGAALHLRPGDARWQRAGRAQGAGDLALGERRRFGAGRGEDLQPALPAPRSRRRRRLRRRPQPAIARGPDRLPARALARRGERGRAGAVRAARLFLPRPGFDAGPAGVQPHDRSARQLGEGAGGEPGEGRGTGMMIRETFPSPLAGAGGTGEAGRVRGSLPQVTYGEIPLTSPLRRNGSPPLPQGERRILGKRGHDGSNAFLQRPCDLEREEPVATGFGTSHI